MTDMQDLTRLTDADFAGFYEKQVRPMFEKAEGERVAGVKTFRTRLIGAIGVAVAVAGILLLFERGGNLSAFAGLFVLAMGGVYAYQPLQALSKRVKGEFLGAVANGVGVTYAAEGAGNASVHRCQRLGIMPGHDRAAYEDFFHGDRLGCQFDLFEAHLETKSTDSKGRTSYSTVFRGIVLRLAFPKSFHGVTIVRRDAGVFNALRGMGELKQVGLGDSKFEKIFEVYSNDQVEARYLVHPVFMERLLFLETGFNGKRIRCAFEDGELVVAVECDNRFELGSMFKPLPDPARARKMIDEFAGVLKLMDAVLTAEQAPLIGRT